MWFTFNGTDITTFGAANEKPRFRAKTHKETIEEEKEALGTAAVGETQPFFCCGFIYHHQSGDKRQRTIVPIRFYRHGRRLVGNPVLVVSLRSLGGGRDRGSNPPLA